MVFAFILIVVILSILFHKFFICHFKLDHLCSNLFMSLIIHFNRHKIPLNLHKVSVCFILENVSFFSCEDKVLDSYSLTFSSFTFLFH